MPDYSAPPQLKLPNNNEQRLTRLSIQFDILEEKGKPDFVNTSQVDHILTNSEIQASRSPSRKSVDTPRWDDVTFFKTEEEDKIESANYDDVPKNVIPKIEIKPEEEKESEMEEVMEDELRCDWMAILFVVSWIFNLTLPRLNLFKCKFLKFADFD